MFMESILKRHNDKYFYKMFMGASLLVLSIIICACVFYYFKIFFYNMGYNSLGEGDIYTYDPFCFACTDALSLNKSNNVIDFIPNKFCQNEKYYNCDVCPILFEINVTYASNNHLYIIPDSDVYMIFYYNDGIFKQELFPIKCNRTLHGKYYENNFDIIFSTIVIVTYFYIGVLLMLFFLCRKKTIHIHAHAKF